MIYFCLPSNVSNAGNNFDNQSIGKSANDNSAETGREFTVEGQRRDVNTIFLKLRIADSSGILLVYFFSFKEREHLFAFSWF
jgi:WNK lysine deficient protein kinase